MVVLITLSALILAEFFVIVEADRVPPGVPKGYVDNKNPVVGARRQAVRACDTHGVGLVPLTQILVAYETSLIVKIISLSFQ
jgi:hypothetical protein